VPPQYARPSSMHASTHELSQTSPRDISTTMTPNQSELVVLESQRLPLSSSDESTSQLHRTTFHGAPKARSSHGKTTANNVVSFHEHKSNDFWSISTNLPAVGYLQITTISAHLPTISVVNSPAKTGRPNSSETTGT